MADNVHGSKPARKDFLQKKEKKKKLNKYAITPAIIEDDSVWKLVTILFYIQLMNMVISRMIIVICMQMMQPTII